MGLALAAGGYSSASALETVTWAPQGSSPQLSSNAPSFTFSQLTLNDFATIYLTPTGATSFTATESGYLQVASAYNGSTYIPAGLNGTAGANPYEIYAQFTATATANVIAPGVLKGSFTSINLQLIGDPGFAQGGHFSFNTSTGLAQAAPGVSPNTLLAGDVLLATGHLTAGQNNNGITDGVPTAAVTTTFTEQAGQTGFFVAPPMNVALNLFGSFTNNQNEVTCFAASATLCGSDIYGGTLAALPSVPAGVAEVLEIGNPVPGGGSADFTAVPEPASLFLFGTGVIGLGAMLRRRRSKKLA